MCACANVCVRLIIFPLHALLADNLITTFSDTLTSRSKIALRNVAHFCQGGGLWDVCVGRYFLPFFFSRLCFSTVSSIVSYLHRRCHQEEERKWMEEGGKMVRSVTSLKKCSSSGLSQAKLLLLQNVCIVKALLTTKNLRCWLFLVYFSAYSPPMTNEF